MTNTKKFKAALVERGFTLSELAGDIGVSTATLSYKLNNKRPFLTTEIKAIQHVLNLSNKERDEIFFGECVE